MRYPGGKKKLRHIIVDRILRGFDGKILEYREPFVGAGAIGLPVISSPAVRIAWLNDFDPGIVCLWDAINNQPEALKDLVQRFTPSIETFYHFKAMLLSGEPGEDPVKYGFAKLAIHQTSFSGLGTKSGGPLGGREQKSKYKIDCRWNASLLCKRIDQIHTLFVMKNVRCTCRDFSEVIAAAGPCLLYLDPPYYQKGGELYQHSFAPSQHSLLANCLRKTDQPWLLSYDDAPEVRELYDFARIVSFPVTYTINTSRSKPELLIAPRNYAHLLDGLPETSAAMTAA